MLVLSLEIAESCKMLKGFGGGILWGAEKEMGMKLRTNS